MSSLFALSTQAGYACRHAGACCSSGWPIPIERAAVAAVQAAIDVGRLRVAATAREADWRLPASGLPGDVAGVLRVAPGGACVFRDPVTRRCVVHGSVGVDALPMACRQFPRIVLADPRGTFVTLSHYCPTAAARLFDPVPLAIVTDPPAFPADAAYDPLDARDVLPPLLHPTILMDWPAYGAWESMLVAQLGRGDVSPGQVLSRAARFVERVRAWRPGPELLTTHMRTTGQVAWETPAEESWGSPREWYGHVLAAVPADVSAPRVPDDVEAVLVRWVDPAWAMFDAEIARYVAAHAFANWTAYQGHGLRGVWRSVAAAFVVLRVEAARQAAGAGRTIDAPLLVEAIRQSDLLLRHLADRQALADRWNQLEPLPLVTQTTETQRHGEP